MGAIEKMLSPKTVAAIGASDVEGSVGHALMKNLLSGKEKRTIYPVNPNRPTVMGLKSYQNVAKIPAHIDLAIIATPAKTVPAIVEECAKAGVDGVVILSAGFREIGADGAKLEEDITKAQSRHQIRILGPNCVGFIRPHIGLNATFLRDDPVPGQIAFISQSGALGSAILNWAVSSHIGFSMFASLGSTLDIGYGDMIDYLGEDPNTRSIIIYMEDVHSARKFMSAARGFARTKPIIVLKAGKHAAGAKAASSHTGALAGDYIVYDAAFKRAGVVRVDEIADLFNCAEVLESRLLPAGPKLGVVTNAGGPAVLAADSIVDHGGELAELSEKSLLALNANLPLYWSHGNPVDVLGDADVKRYELAVETCMLDPNIDGLLVIYTPQGATSPTEVAQAITKLVAKRRKPLLTVWMGEDSVREARQIFHSNNIPTYSTPEEAMKTYMYMYRYRRNLDLLYETPQELSIDISPPKNHLKIIIQKTKENGRSALTQVDVDRFLDAYEIPRVKGKLARDVDQAVMIAAEIGYPVVIKIASEDILHKTDVGGVVTSIVNSDSLREQYKLLLERMKQAKPEAKIDGVYVQKMLKKADYELILGSKKDRDFGAIILFGSGGIGVELFKDFSVGIPPLNQNLARRILEETRIYQALSKGLRNKPPIDMKSLEEIMVRFSNMIVDLPEISEMDINPLAVSDGKLWALDARIIIDPAIKLRRSEPYPHLVMMPYPTKYVTPWRLREGTEVMLRPIKPEDEPMELDFIRGLSTETSRFRFFQIIKDLPHDALVRFCNIDYDREMAFIAETTDLNTNQAPQRIEIGVSRLILDPNRRRGEIAVVIADKFQGKGLGTKLVDMLIEVARDKGVEALYGVIMSGNMAMIRLCEKLGFAIRREQDSVLAELKLNY
ncbi:MAG TPA: GNAT family N-acetyltransferase [Candidatus Bathyarchaeia archaeon]|nr:GNAT family N-acetyltransferase [Candidatus Bathyarchaeia archaeon]